MALVRVTTRVDNRAGVSRELSRAIESALQEIADNALEESNRIVPLEEGVLSDSGFVEVEKTGEGKWEGQVAYATPYAVVQHEDPSLRHDPGREDHYLEKTVNARTSVWERHVADKVKRAAR